MIFDGNLMTMKDHFVRSNNMNTCEQVWSLDIKIKDKDNKTHAASNKRIDHELDNKFNFFGHIK